MNRIREIQELGARWAHVDITDGTFSKTPTWHDAVTYANAGISIEVHLMVARPELVVDEWLGAGARRIIIHVESLRGRDGGAFSSIAEKCNAHGAVLALSLNPETSVEELAPYIESLAMVHLLAVNPGPSGQQFDERIIGKIKNVRAQFPSIAIEIDGGVNPHVLRMAKEAGATHAVVASYIFESADMRSAFEALRLA